RYPECKGTVNIGTGKKKSPGKSAKTRTATTKTA
ncbi:hypothetical protein PSYPI_43861, partial [Pseudomonas syringae pv. pisi str. 1704B]